MASKEVTSKKAASAVSKVLRNKESSKAAKLAAGYALSQRTAPVKITSRYIESAVSKTLRKSSYSKSSKTASGSALTQRPNRRK